ncbi:MAG TPA: hypothetical protein VGO84_18720 [Burkholderiales bacterium]|nr:hypothetical protein [Burkholderiales bacterium]
MKKALLTVALLMGFGGPVAAVGNLADLSVYDRAENRTLPVYFHDGRYYIAGKPGNEYQINIRNNQPGEVLGVIAVDGVNAVSGETANWSQTGYVLSPYTSFGVKGWRKSLQRTAAFFFTELEKSYAARTARPDNVGVIGIAVFRRKVEPTVGINRYQERKREDEAANGPASEPQSSAKDEVAQAAGRAESEATRVAPAPEPKKLGTGHGQSETSVVRYANFERASSSPDEVITIYYDSYPNLVAQGVIREHTRLARPNPFPGQFVPDLR